MITAIGITICTLTVFLLLAGERISDRIRAARAAKVRRAWIDDRIRTERHTAKRAAWRSIRDDDLEGL